MDHDKLKALTVAATEARTQEMLATAAMQAAKLIHEAAQAEWKDANDHWQSSHKALNTFTEESIRKDAAAEVEEYRTCA